MLIQLILFIIFGIFYEIWAVKKDNGLKLITVATEATDGFLRLQKSAEEFGHELIVFGMGEEWKGGNMRLNTVIY